MGHGQRWAMELDAPVLLFVSHSTICKLGRKIIFFQVKGQVRCQSCLSGSIGWEERRQSLCRRKVKPPFWEQSSVVCWLWSRMNCFPRVTMTKCHHLGALNHRNLLSQSGGWKCEINMWAGLVSSVAFPLGMSSSCVLTWSFLCVYLSLHLLFL